MRIVILDAHTANPGDLSWSELEKLGECVVYDRTPPELALERAAGAQIVLTNKTRLDGNTIRQLKGLKYIGVLATGYNVVDMPAALECGVAVTNIPTYGTASVSQMTFALILELANHAGHHAKTVRDGRWCASEDFCYWDNPLVELQGLTIGIVGFGRIGQSVAKIAKGFEMEVLAYDNSLASSPIPGVEMTDLGSLLGRSDIVTLHCPLTDGNKSFINAQSLSTMKSNAFLINTSRGPLIDEAALAGALNSGRIAGAGLDVLSVEPPRADNPLLRAKNCVITPHIAWATQAARRRLIDTAIENLRTFIAGSPVNIVN